MPHIASMGIYVVKASVMKELLLGTYPTANDFGSEIIPGAVAEGKRVQACLLSWMPFLTTTHVACNRLTNIRAGV